MTDNRVIYPRARKHKGGGKALRVGTFDSLPWKIAARRCALYSRAQTDGKYARERGSRNFHDSEVVYARPFLAPPAGWMSVCLCAFTAFESRRV